MSKSNEGSAFQVRLWPELWPPREPYSLGYVSTEFNQVRWTGHPSGSIEVEILDSAGTPLWREVFQPVQVLPNSQVLLIAQWSPSILELHVNNAQLKPASESQKVVVVSSKVRETTEPASLDDPNRVASCQKWIDWRKVRFPQSTNARTNRRLKSGDEQADDLRRATLSLTHLVDRILDGDLYLLGHLVTELRALIYWRQDKDGNYNPLLLRVASLGELPLPVYGMAPSPLPVKPWIHLAGHTPEFVKTAPAQRLMDLQEWLEQTQLTQYDAALPGGERSTSNRALLSEAANTLGCAHYDEDVSEFAELMHQFGSGNAGAIYSYFIYLARAVAMLSDWCLAELESRGVISARMETS